MEGPDIMSLNEDYIYSSDLGVYRVTSESHSGELLSVCEGRRHVPTVYIPLGQRSLWKVKTLCNYSCLCLTAITTFNSLFSHAQEKKMYFRDKTR